MSADGQPPTRPEDLERDPDRVDGPITPVVAPLRSGAECVFSLSAAMRTFLLLLPAVLVGAVVSAGWHAGTGQPSAAAPTPTIDPRLIVQPRTSTQAVSLGGLQVLLVASPLIPGTNRLVVRLTDHGLGVTGARVSIAAGMVGMLMRPLRFGVREVGNGRYEADGPLPMFGPWRLSVGIERRGGTVLSHTFVLGLNLPPALLP